MDILNKLSFEEQKFNDCDYQAQERTRITIKLGSFTSGKDDNSLRSGINFQSIRD